MEVSDEGKFTMPAYPVTVTATALKTLSDYTFDSGKGDANIFKTTGGTITASVSTDDDKATIGADKGEDDRALKLVHSSGGGNLFQCYSQLDLSETLATSEIIQMDFDIFITGEHRSNFAVRDSADHVLFRVGETGTNDCTFDDMSNTKTRMSNSAVGKWVTVHMDIDRIAGKYSYKVTNKADGSAFTTDSNNKVPFANKCSLAPGVSIAGILFTEWNSGTGYIDNILVKGSEGAAQTITIKYLEKGEENNTAITDPEDKGDKTINWVQGVTYTVPEDMKANFDVSTEDTARYVFNEEASENLTINSSNAAETVNLVFDKIEYVNVPFKVTVSGEGKEGVDIIINGSAADDPDVKKENVKITSSTGGAASIKLLPGTYQWEVKDAFAEGYEGKSGEITVVSGIAEQAVELDPHTQVFSAMEIDDSKLNGGTIITGTAREIGVIDTVQYDADETTEMKAKASVTYEVTTTDGTQGGVTVSNSDGKVSITGEATPGTYKITAKAKGGADSNTDITAEKEIVLAAAGTETIAAASENFEGSTNIFGITAVSADSKTMGIYDTSSNSNFGTDTMFKHVLTLGEKGDAGGSTDGDTNLNTTGKTATFAQKIDKLGDTVKITFNPFISWTDASDAVQEYSFASSTGNVFSFKVTQSFTSANAGLSSSASVTSVKFGDTEVIEDAASPAGGHYKPFQFVNCTNKNKNDANANGWTHAKQPFVASDYCTVTLTINTADGTATANFKSIGINMTGGQNNSKGCDVTVSGDIGDFTDIASMTVKGAYGKAQGTGLSFDNLASEVTKNPAD